jgi:hypothetical protein
MATQESMMNTDALLELREREAFSIGGNRYQFSLEMSVAFPGSNFRIERSVGIACWFIGTNYNEESFFVHHAYFLGANDPYSALKTILIAEINEEAWATLNIDTSRAFDKPKSGRIAVEVINHLGDEVMKAFRV